MSLPKVLRDIESQHFIGDVDTSDPVVALTVTLAAADRQIRVLNERVDMLLDLIQPGATWGWVPQQIVEAHQFIRPAGA